jgi:NAD(P)H-flavin reductase
MIPRPFRIVSRRREIKDTVTLALEPESGEQAFSFEPGQFNMLYVFGVGEIPVSVSGDPASPEPLIHTVRAVGAVSAGLTALARGGTVGVRGPFGTGWPVESAFGSDVVIVAGGLGLAPLRPAIYRILAQRKRFGRVVLLYGTRGPGEILYKAELEQWRRRLDVDIDVTVDHATGDWHGNVGVVTEIVKRAGFDPDHAIAMICGPEIMMRFTIATLRERGVAVERIYLSMERNMKCAIGLCGHCQFGPAFICRDGPVMRFDRIQGPFSVREI